MQAGPLPLSFLDTYSLTTSSLGCNTLCMVIIIIIVVYSLEFFTYADGFSLEFEWQQVSLSLQDTTQYSVRFQ